MCSALDSDILHLGYAKLHNSDLTATGPTLCIWNDQHQRSAVPVRKIFFRGPVGRQVPQLQTSTVCPLIRSPGCHSIHHPAARHTAPLSRILRLQSGFHTHPLMTKPDTGTDSSSSVGSQWKEIRGGWYPILRASANPCKTISTERLSEVSDIIWGDLKWLWTSFNDTIVGARESRFCDKVHEQWVLQRKGKKGFEKRFMT